VILSQRVGHYVLKSTLKFTADGRWHTVADRLLITFLIRWYDRIYTMLSSPCRLLFLIHHLGSFLLVPLPDPTHFE
jgi:hypothetical protein